MCPPTLIEHEKDIYREQMANSGKPPQVVDKIVEGKLDKWYSEVCLLEQPFVKNPDVTIKDLADDDHRRSWAKTCKVRRFRPPRSRRVRDRAECPARTGWAFFCRRSVHVSGVTGNISDRRRKHDG